MHQSQRPEMRALRSAAMRGERNPEAKLTPDAVHAIRASTERVGVLARQYNVSHTAISLIRSRRTWAWLKP